MWVYDVTENMRLLAQERGLEVAIAGVQRGGEVEDCCCQGEAAELESLY